MSYARTIEIAWLLSNAMGGYEQEVSMARQRWREDGTASAGDAANARANSWLQNATIMHVAPATHPPTPPEFQAGLPNCLIQGDQ